MMQADGPGYFNAPTLVEVALTTRAYITVYNFDIAQPIPVRYTWMYKHQQMNPIVSSRQFLGF